MNDRSVQLLEKDVSYSCFEILYFYYRYPNENNLGSTHVRANEKTLCNVKDLEIEEINSLEKDEAINYVKLCKKIIERKNNEIKRLRRKNKRLKIKVSHFKSLFQHPKKKQMPSEQIAV